MLPRWPVRRLLGSLLALVAIPAFSQQLGLHELLAQAILAPNQTSVEAQVFTASRVPALRVPFSVGEWEEMASAIRKRVLDEVVFRGEARRWRDAQTRVEWLDRIPGGAGYNIRKLRYEAIPGLWIPALLYVPADLDGVAPVVINVNGHDRVHGKASEQKQLRCINLAKRGLLALNPEWVGMGQLATPGFDHYKINQLDLLGTSGIAIHYLALSRAIDLMLKHPNADPDRIAVTGLSGGGWQTIFIGALDERVALANPVAGYSSFVTRAQFPATDLGDSEQTPSDLATVADYTHLTAMRAPRPTLLTKNARDTCCFQAGHALGPLLRAARPAFELHRSAKHLREHVNQDPGHNYARDNREALYRMLRDFFFAGSTDFPIEEIDAAAELQASADLEVPLPVPNRDFHSLALELLGSTGPRGQGTRGQLEAITKTPRYAVRATEVGLVAAEAWKATRWRLHMDQDWTVPAVEIEPDSASGTVLLVADGGRTSSTGSVRDWLGRGYRVIALDPYAIGESQVQPRGWLWSLLIAALGERPLGILAGQIAATARWTHARNGEPVTVHAIGPRTSLASLVGAALEATAVSGVVLEESFNTLAEIVVRDITARQAPEFFCFGLFESFDIPEIQALVAPRPVSTLPN